MVFHLLLPTQRQRPNSFVEIHYQDIQFRFTNPGYLFPESFAKQDWTVTVPSPLPTSGTSHPEYHHSKPTTTKRLDVQQRREHHRQQSQTPTVQRVRPDRDERPPTPTASQFLTSTSLWTRHASSITPTSWTQHSTQSHHNHSRAIRHNLPHLRHLPLQALTQTPQPPSQSYR